MKKLNDINYNRTVIKLHGEDWVKVFTSAYASMIGSVCVVSQYPQFYY